MLIFGARRLLSLESGPISSKQIFYVFFEKIVEYNIYFMIKKKVVSINFLV